ncbi:MAG: hypothetical protein P1U68_00775 [Verrucomicrobiales bacterium]|nr:hypothetical protein [Verrucomicrobiales bacterium]
MISRPLLHVLVFVLVAGGSFATTAEAQIGFRSNRINDTLRRQERRQLYRPNIHVTRGASGSKVFHAGTSIPFEYRTKQGFVSKIEIRSGLKVIKTIHPGQSSSGRGSFTLTAADFAKAGKTGSKLKFKLWGWQGRNGMQSVHGESIGYTLIP